MTDTRKPRVLIFDDDTRVLTMFEKSFSLKGHEVFSFAEPDFFPIYKGSGGACRKQNSVPTLSLRISACQA